MHRAWAEVNLDNVAHNTGEVRRLVGRDKKILAVVKAEGYGHGSVEVSRAMLESGADALGIATCDEGIKLRESGIIADILVMAHSPEERFREVIDAGLVQTVSNPHMARALSDAAVSLGKIAEIHVKIDSGMRRIGFKPTMETVDDIIGISRLPSVKLSGVFSHLAMSESADKAFSYAQNEKFMFVVNALREKGFTDFITHLCNSGGILGYPDLHCDMVRPGIILYGVYPSAETEKHLDLKPVMSIKARISHISMAETGESVGYDRTFFAKRPTKVGTIIIGYADGYPSVLSNKSRVIAGETYAPVIGQICMDQMMIDLTDAENVKEGDEVILLGKKGGLEIPAEELAKLSGSKIREVLCISNIRQRIPRVYTRS